MKPFPLLLLWYNSIICAYVPQILQALEPVALAPAWFAVTTAQQQATFVAIQAQLQQQHATILAIQAQLHQLQADAAANNVMLLEAIVNAPIKRSNFMSMAPENTIYPLEINGAVPANFPGNRAALLELPGIAVNHLLAFYGLNQQGGLPARRQRLFTFLGLRIV
jgi:hypothetical protein